MRSLTLALLVLLPAFAAPVALAEAAAAPDLSFQCLPARPPQPQLCYGVTTAPETCVTLTYGRFLLLHECLPLATDETCASTPTSSPTYACVVVTPEGSVCVRGAHGHIPFDVCPLPPPPGPSAETGVCPVADRLVSVCVTSSPDAVCAEVTVSRQVPVSQCAPRVLP